MRSKMTDTNSLILSPYNGNGIAVRNRVAVAPMTRISATEDGYPTDTMFDYYTRFAKGGFGLVTTEVSVSTWISRRRTGAWLDRV
jgi:2,4-dienoyl-CoA reductase-like NADH-dependent reductase (Old Yellow Enzyme family)